MMVVCMKNTRAGTATIDAADADTNMLSSIRMKQMSAIMLLAAVVMNE
jgi:hypothetical protein